MLSELCDEPVYRGSMAEGPAAVIPSAQRRLQGGGQAARVVRFSGSFPPQKILRTRWVVLTHVKDNSDRKRVTCDKDGGSHGRDRQVREILSPGLRSRRIRRNGKEAVRGRGFRGPADLCHVSLHPYRMSLAFGRNC